MNKYRIAYTYSREAATPSDYIDTIAATIPIGRYRPENTEGLFARVLSYKVQALLFVLAKICGGFQSQSSENRHDLYT